MRRPSEALPRKSGALVRRANSGFGHQQKGLERDRTLRKGMAGPAADKALRVMVEHVDDEERLPYGRHGRGGMHTDFAIPDPCQGNAPCIILRATLKADKGPGNSQRCRIVLKRGAHGSNPRFVGRSANIPTPALRDAGGAVNVWKCDPGVSPFESLSRRCPPRKGT